MYVKYPGSCKITYSQAYTVVFGVGCSTVVPANRRKGQTQKDVHLEESNANDPHNFLNLSDITEISSVSVP